MGDVGDGPQEPRGHCGPSLNSRPGRNPNADYRKGVRVPTIQCESCGAQYYSAACDQLLELVVALSDCDMCAERGPMRVIDAGVGYLAEEPEHQAS